jgi:hypothetical protein
MFQGISSLTKENDDGDHSGMVLLRVRFRLSVKGQAVTSEGLKRDEVRPQIAFRPGRGKRFNAHCTPRE